MCYHACLSLSTIALLLGSSSRHNERRFLQWSTTATWPGRGLVVYDSITSAGSMEGTLSVLHPKTDGDLTEQSCSDGTELRLELAGLFLVLGWEPSNCDVLLLPSTATFIGSAGDPYRKFGSLCNIPSGWTQQNGVSCGGWPCSSSGRQC